MDTPLPPNLTDWVVEQPDCWQIWQHNGDYDDWTKIGRFEKEAFDAFLDKAYDLGVDFVVQYLDGSQEYHLLVKE